MIIYIFEQKTKSNKQYSPNNFITKIEIGFLGQNSSVNYKDDNNRHKSIEFCTIQGVAVGRI